VVVLVATNALFMEPVIRIVADVSQPCSEGAYMIEMSRRASEKPTSRSERETLFG